MAQRLLCLVLGAAALSIPVVGRAQKEPARRSSSRPPAPPPVRYDFEADIVGIGRLAPESERVAVRRADRQPSLVKVRASFLPEMLRSAEDH